MTCALGLIAVTCFHFSQLLRRDDEVEGAQDAQSEESEQQAATWDDLDIDDDEEESSGYESDQPASRPKQQSLKKGGVMKKKTMKAIVKQDKKASRKRVVRRYFPAFSLNTQSLFMFILISPSFPCRYGDGENDEEVLESSAKPGRQKVVHGKIGSQFFTEVDVKGKGRFKGLKNIRLPERQ
jgi:hypothetical protein